MILRGPMMCTSFEDTQDLITRSQFAKYYASKLQYCNQVALFQSTPRLGQKPHDFPRFSEFEDPKGWCGRSEFVFIDRLYLSLTFVWFAVPVISSETIRLLWITEMVRPNCSPYSTPNACTHAFSRARFPCMSGALTACSQRLHDHGPLQSRDH